MGSPSSVPKPLKVPSLARSVPKPLKVASLARSVPKPLKVLSLARSLPKPLKVVDLFLRFIRFSLRCVLTDGMDGMDGWDGLVRTCFCFAYCTKTT